MDDEVAIKVEHVSKKFCRYLKRSMLYGIHDIGRNLLGMSTKPDKLRKDEFWAVDDVSFEVHRGETLGIIGPNGSGKSTILKLLNGIFMPDKGKIEINGRVGALIEIGAGFHPLLTGRENIYVNGAILGMSKEEIDDKFDDIIEFADIGDFLDTPIKFYSSGMFVRLGFAVAVHCEPDILLVDEVLAVGDMAFQTKCFKKMHEFVREEKTIVFISHSMPAVQGMCKRTLWLNRGKIRAEGETRVVVALYSDEMNKRAGVETHTQGAFIPVSREGSGEIRIVNVEVMDESDTPINIVRVGGVLKIRMTYRAFEPICDPHFQFGIRDMATGIMVTFVDVNSQNSPIPKIIQGIGIVECIFDPIFFRPRRYGLYLRIGYPTQAFDIWDDGDSRFIVSGVGLSTESGFLYGRDDLVGVPFKVRHISAKGKA
jgi:lipopolysaccharide transport system ATP-binding protein